MQEQIDAQRMQFAQERHEVLQAAAEPIDRDDALIAASVAAFQLGRRSVACCDGSANARSHCLLTLPKNCCARAIDPPAPPKPVLVADIDTRMWPDCTDRMTIPSIWSKVTMTPMGLEAGLQGTPRSPSFADAYADRRSLVLETWPDWCKVAGCDLMR
jgi:hypothetical protein